MIVLPGFPVTMFRKDEPIEFIGQSTSIENTVTIPAHRRGDLILIVAARLDTSSTPPGIGAGFTSIWAQGGGQNWPTGIRVGYKIADDDADVSGTWTNASRMCCAVYRNARGIGAVSTRLENAPGTRIQWPAITPNNPPAWVVGLAVGNVGGGPNAPTGYVNRSTVGGVQSIARIVDTGGPVDYMPLTQHPYNIENNARLCTLELRGPI